MHLFYTFFHGWWMKFNIHFKWQLIASTSVQTDAQKQPFKIGVWNTVEYVVENANVFLLGLMGTSMNALATETRLTKRASLNALNLLFCFRSSLSLRLLVFLCKGGFTMYVGFLLFQFSNVWGVRSEKD